VWRTIAANADFERVSFQECGDRAGEDGAVGGESEGHSRWIVVRVTLDQVCNVLEKRKLKQRFSAKEADFNVVAGRRMTEEKIEGASGRRQRHCGATLCNVAIRASQIAAKRGAKRVPAWPTTLTKWSILL
jgi:hypothetical protein